MRGRGLRWALRKAEPVWHPHAGRRHHVSIPMLEDAYPYWRFNRRSDLQKHRDDSYEGVQRALGLDWRAANYPDLDLYTGKHRAVDAAAKQAA